MQTTRFQDSCCYTPLWERVLPAKRTPRYTWHPVASFSRVEPAPTIGLVSIHVVMRMVFVLFAARLALGRR